MVEHPMPIERRPARTLAPPCSRSKRPRVRRKGSPMSALTVSIPTIDPRPKVRIYRTPVSGDRIVLRTRTSKAALPAKP